MDDISRERKMLTRLEPNQAYEMLGVFLSFDGNNEKQFSKTKDGVSMG